MHSTFGTGEVVQTGPYKGVETIWTAFDFGAVEAPDMQYAAPHIRIRWHELSVPNLDWLPR